MINSAAAAQQKSKDGNLRGSVKGKNSDSKKIKKLKINKDTDVYATGTRKTSVARVWLKPSGSGKVVINGKELNEYFNFMSAKNIAFMPFFITNNNDQYDIVATVKGGGLLAQVQAVKFGIAKALSLHNPAVRTVLKRNKLLTVDCRRKEPKKYGLLKARKAPQFSKR